MRLVDSSEKKNASEESKQGVPFQRILKKKRFELNSVRVTGQKVTVIQVRSK